MIKTNTVLILGAGASWDYGFPVGTELRNQICRGIFEGDPYLEQNWKRNVLTPFAHTLLESRLSVDAFLEEHPDDLAMGKFAIASKLLPLENKRLLYDAWLYPEKAEVKDKNHWYDILFEKLIDGTDFDNFKDNKLSVITFNYDRSFEHFLFSICCGKRKPAMSSLRKQGSRTKKLDSRLRGNDKCCFRNRYYLTPLEVAARKQRKTKPAVSRR